MDTQQEDTFQIREQRVNDAVEIKVPDRIPMYYFTGFYPIRHCGFTIKDAYYDMAKLTSAFDRTVSELKPDLYQPPSNYGSVSGKALEHVGMKQIKWPGYNLPDDVTFQFVEKEYISAEELDALLDDPSDFLFRYYLPRICGNLTGLGQMPSLKMIAGGYGAFNGLAMFAAPEIKSAFKALAAAIDESATWAFGLFGMMQKLQENGFPALAGATTLVPHDLVSDMFRGMRGAIMDMYRCPDKLLAVQEKVLPLLIESAILQCQMSGNKRVFIPLHRGADGFMSLEQFETFYWPDLKKMLLAFIDAGITPCPFFEGSYDQRLEYLAELPKGKILGLFDQTDLVRAKDIIGDTICIVGGMPISLLQVGTPKEVKAHTKEMIEKLGKNGGYIMGTSCTMDEAKPELVKVWTETTAEYGVY